MGALAGPNGGRPDCPDLDASNGPALTIPSAHSESVRARREGLRYGLEPFGHTIEDAQPRSRTVMTDREPSPADLERVLEAAPQEFESPILGCLRLRVDHLVRHQSRVNDPG
jgi:hypothetical protein